MRKNILFINHVSSLGGAERFLCSVIEALDKEYNVFFICQERGPLSEVLAARGVTIEFMPLPAWRKIRFVLANFLRVRAIIHFCKLHHIDLICSNNYRVSSYAVWPAKLRRIPVVTIIQDFVPRHKLWKFNTFGSDLLIVVSNAIGRPISRYYKREIITIYNGIDVDAVLKAIPSYDALRSEFPVLKDKHVIGMIAQVVPLKRHQLFLESMQEVLKQRPDVMCVVIGESPSNKQLSLDDLKAHARQLNMQDQVIFTGARNDVPVLLKSFDVLVHPADKEPFGRVIMEAMALGVPVVATQSGGPSEIIEDGISGYLVDVGDKNKIVERVLHLLEDKQQRTIAGKKGQERIRQMFNLESTVKRCNGVFEKLLR